ncbi:hypothetical protein FDP41_003521 [Naegleria fowleri]|uniref:F-box domain-containing protein n=1 Tax=Naegleria fowleri TaxID=5763 RepID=A0A6A5BX76_NAEFO|nr:uncharacterized protein FDP41_003521 [Naegleria fowleri]KAF0977529.1 hypothetical protein FDP41_003521 [Naegleria fowleri]CAG4710181.1 unnamed protein product [Naegleria fowleri]
MLKFIPEELLEFHVCSFLDLGTVMSLSFANKLLYELISKSEVIWTQLTIHPHADESCHADDDQASELLKYLGLRLRKDLNDDDHPPILDDQELFTIFKNKRNQFLFHWFRLFSFCTTGFPKYNPSYNDLIVSKIRFTNGNHSLRVMHDKLKGDWETCIANKKLHRGITYYWCVHLTTYDEENANNAWVVLIGVDNLENQPRDGLSSSMHYWFGRSPSKGFGYCVASDSGYNSYEGAHLNKQGDVIGVEFYHDPHLNQVRMKFYPKNGCEERSYNFSYTTLDEESRSVEVSFRPAVSVVSNMAVSIFPWDGNVETLKNFYPNE